MRILIVLVNYNGRNLLKSHLPSVLDTEYKDFDVVVVDNGSKDGSIGFLKKNYPNVKIIQSDENLGFGRANNLAVYTYPNYDAYVFLNNDISVEKNWLTELSEVVQSKNGVGAVGCKILYSEKKNGRYIINSAGMILDNHYMAYDRYLGEEDSKKFNIVEKVDALSGGALLVTRDALNDVGGFNSHMFMYYEDVDLSLRLRDFGYTLYYCGLSTVYHDHMGSSRKISSTKRNLMNMRNRYISIGTRKGFLIGFTETFWYLFNWGIWRVFYSNRFSLKEYLYKKQ